MSFPRFGGTFIIGFATAACGIDVVGIADLDAGGPESGIASSTSSGGATSSSGASTSSSGGSSGGPITPPPGCDAAGCNALDAKWKPFAAAIGPAAATCGAGNPTVLRTNPVAGAGACGCTAASPVPPSCVNGQVTFKVGSGCTSTGVITSSSSTTCHPVTGSLASSVAFASLAPTGGSCVAQSTSDANKVTTDALTLCVNPCAADICAKKPPNGFRACVVADGDVACDAAGFTEKHLAGTAANVKCADCTSCKATATCTNASIDLYSSSTCGTKVFTLPADACTPTGGAAGDGIGGMIYNVTVTPKYEASGPLTATAGLDAVRTVCCAP